MKYFNADKLLPKELVAQLQDYLQGGYLYVPAAQHTPHRAKRLSAYQQELRSRNAKIKKEHRAGVSVEALAEKYFLSVHAIRKIVYKK